MTEDLLINLLLYIIEAVPVLMVGFAIYKLRTKDKNDKDK